MTEVDDQDLREFRGEAESTRDEPLSGAARRPGSRRAKVLSVRLNPEEFDELTRYAAALGTSVSALVRGWTLQQLTSALESPVSTVERIAQELDQLRRQLAG